MASQLTLIKFDSTTHAHLVEPLTKMLREAYAPLAARGMRYIATHQPPEKTLERLCDGESYLALTATELVGTIMLYRKKVLSKCEYNRQPGAFSFGQVAVRQSQQGKGFGARLMDLVEERARELGPNEIALDTSEHARELIPTYERPGYKLVARTPNPLRDRTQTV